MQRMQIPVPIVILTLSCASAAVCFAAATRSVWDGVFTKEQSTRGLTVWREECAKCHGENLAGGEAAPGLVGDDFLGKWKGKTTGDLFELIRKTMPTDDPGNLSRRQYADVSAYILSANQFPAGKADLTPDLAALNEVRIEGKK